MLVLGRHLPFAPMETTNAWLRPLQIWQFLGWIGVDLFFVLSGFLVSGILFREYQRQGQVQWSRFFIRRGVRIYAPFYAYLVFSLLLRPSHLQLDRLATEFFFLQSYFPRRALWNHTWSLAVEEHFYIFLGLLMMSLSRNKTSNPFRLLVPVALFLALGCLVLRTLTPYDSPSVFVSSHLRFDSLFFGVLLSYYYHFYQKGFKDTVRRSRSLLYALIMAGLVPPFLLMHTENFEPWMARGGFTFLYLAFGSILAMLVSREATEKKPIHPLVIFIAVIGQMSYSIYLWHMVAREAWMGWGRVASSPWYLWMISLLYALFALALGWASYRWIEKPSLLWRDKHFPARDR